MKVNKRFLRYILFFLSILVFSFAIQVFVQNFNIEKEIYSLKNKQILLSGETYWLKNYYKPFLKSKEAKIYFSHKAGINLEGEKIVEIINYNNENNIIDKINEKKYNQVHNRNNFSSCKEFFRNLYRKYLSL